MEDSDVNRRCVVFDRPDDPHLRGLTGTVIAVYDAFNFRFKTDSNQEYEFCTKLVKIKFLGES